MDDYGDFEDDVEVFYAALEQEDETHGRHGCGGCFLFTLLTLMFAIILLIFLWL